MKLALIVDNRQMTRWQQAALERLRLSEPLLVLNCTNTRFKRRLGKHFLYYLLNRFTIRNRWSSKVPLEASSLPVREVIDFESGYEGAWQRLPDAAVDRLKAERPVAIVKFGMGLLRVPPELGIPILSYHHGDPDEYRGRPAGFWESHEGRQRMGQIVQVISDRLDAGAVIAYAETRIVRHSYRATMIQAYRHSPLLLARALDNLVHGRRIAKRSDGRNCRLPGNLVVARFLLRQAGAAMSRLAYGALFEKRWTVAKATAPARAVVEQGAFPPPSEWRNVPVARRYTFYADPFYVEEPAGILVEALNRRSGKGELLLIADGGGERLVSDPGRHFSYPATVREGDRLYVVPEIAHWSAPRIFAWGDGRLQEVARLDMEGNGGITDPTFLRHDGRVYLFGNKAEMGCDALCLWSSETLFGRFVEHPASPILISPFGGRMAGQIVRSGSSIYRLGQNGLGSYGNGSLAFRIEALGPADYSETFLREIRFGGVRGPHTLNWSGDEVLFDWYRERFSSLAWFRRLRMRAASGAAEG